ncbi:Lrp/AsnC family transcriptional regulator [Rhodococcus fascians]|nr:Lrp/AsnC family transcriptional regulator [Rhodococcus fascians]MBY4238715.1 Lrp/AsnC family transcriptional regulator [Rhodococcus fascians]MBY4254696.1 Lrp/AsnC family transcriptional regulator [Rhodococcus fascians]MBY4270070.1 Lrp/AsnC family transcriptional regulator [Rhodococcus fascians]
MPEPWRFTVQVDHAVCGLGTSAFIALSIRQDSWRTVAEVLRAMEFVDHFSLWGGDFDVLALVRTPDNESLRRVTCRGSGDL